MSALVDRLRRRSVRPLLTVGGLACLVGAAFAVALPLGLAAAGGGLLVLEWLSDDGGPR